MGKQLGNYLLKIMPDVNPKDIMVDGKVIPGFDKDIKAYSYLFNKGAKVPVVKAEAEGEDITVDITQAQNIPGTAVVKFIDNKTYEKNVYYINFGVNSTSDEFNGSIGKQWEWVRENPANHSLTKKAGSLTITTEKGDISENSNDAKNILLQNANSDWTIETKLVGSRIPSQPENAGLLAYQDDDNFVKLVYRASARRGGFGFGGPTTEDGRATRFSGTYC